MKNELRQLATTSTGMTAIINPLRRPSRDSFLACTARAAVRLNKPFEPGALVTIADESHAYHDGAAIVHLYDEAGDVVPTIVWVRVMLPLVQRRRPGLTIPGAGTRHTTLYDASELTDALCFPVSKQRSEVSFMRRGAVKQNVDDNFIIDTIVQAYLESAQSNEQRDSCPITETIQRDLVVTCRNQKYHARSHRDYYELCYKEAHLQLHENHPIGSIIDDLPRYLDGSELVVPGTYAYEFIENFVEFNGRSNLEKYVTHRRIARANRTRPTMAYKIIDFGNVYIGGFGMNISHELSTIFLSNVFVRRELLHNGFLLHYLSSLFREAPYNLLDRFVFFMQPHVKDSFAEITQQCNAKESPEMLEIAGLHPLYNAAFACSIDDLHEGFGALDDDDDEFGPLDEDDEELL